MQKIAICIPTYKRPVYLNKCIESLLKQEGISFDIIVIDNDASGSSQSMIKSLDPNIIYLIECKRGIPHVRNTAVDFCKNNNYDLIAFIDDDEEAEVDWMIILYNTLIKYNADVVHGVVLPNYESRLPLWAKNSKFALYNPKRMNTGDPLKCCATNNILMKIRIFDNFDFPFDSRMVKTGGSDTLFFTSIWEKYKMIWCDEAIVKENIPDSRQTLRWNLMRTFRNGNATALIMKIRNKNKERKKELLNWIIKLPFKLVFVPFFIILSIIFYYFLGHKIVIKLLARIYYGFGFIMGNIGFKYSEYKKIHGK